MKTLKMVNLKKIILIVEEPVGLVASVMQMLKIFQKLTFLEFGAI